MIIISNNKKRIGIYSDRTQVVKAMYSGICVGFLKVQDGYTVFDRKSILPSELGAFSGSSPQQTPLYGHSGPRRKINTPRPKHTLLEPYKRDKEKRGKNPQGIGKPVPPRKKRLTHRELPANSSGINDSPSLTNTTGQYP